MRALSHHVSSTHVHFSFWLTNPAPTPPAPPITTPTVGPFHCLCPSLDAAPPISDVGSTLPTPTFKAQFPAVKGSLGHRLFIFAFIFSSKIICDDTYSKKLWCIVSQGRFTLWEINQMEREMCSCLEWQLNVNPSTLLLIYCLRILFFLLSGPLSPFPFCMPAPYSCISNLPGSLWLSAIPLPQHDYETMQ